MKAFMTRLDKHSTAPPEVVYDTLADLQTHLEWGGVEQRSDFRLLSLDAPEGPATVGTWFISTGAIPMSVRTWSDRSTVTIAERPDIFEFVTQATARRPRRSMEATYRHRYEITAAPGGSRVTYTFTQLEASHPFLRMALPVVRAMTWRVGIPFLAGRGFRRLLATAERRTTLEGVPVATSSIDGHGSFQTVK